MIHWNEYPLNVVTEILLHDFNTGKNIFDGDINFIVPRAQKSDYEKNFRSCEWGFFPSLYKTQTARLTTTFKRRILSAWILSFPVVPRRPLW